MHTSYTACNPLSLPDKPLITIYGGARKVRETLEMARRVAGGQAPLCSIVWIESPGRGRGLMLPRPGDLTPTEKFPWINRLALIGDLDTGEVVSSTLTKWLEERERSTGWTRQGGMGQWKRLMPDRDNLATGQALTYLAARKDG